MKTLSQQLRAALIGLVFSLSGITASTASDLIDATRAGDAGTVASLISILGYIVLLVGVGLLIFFISNPSEGIIKLAGAPLYLFRLLLCLYL